MPPKRTTLSGNDFVNNRSRPNNHINPYNVTPGIMMAPSTNPYIILQTLIGLAILNVTYWRLTDQVDE